MHFLAILSSANSLSIYFKRLANRMLTYLKGKIRPLPSSNIAIYCILKWLKEVMCIIYGCEWLWFRIFLHSSFCFFFGHLKRRNYIHRLTFYHFAVVILSAFIKRTECDFTFCHNSSQFNSNARILSMPRIHTPTRQTDSKQCTCSHPCIFRRKKIVCCQEPSWKKATILNLPNAKTKTKRKLSACHCWGAYTLIQRVFCVVNP